MAVPASHYFAFQQYCHMVLSPLSEEPGVATTTKDTCSFTQVGGYEPSRVSP